MTSPRSFFLSAIILTASAASHAATLTFDTASDFDNNFWSSETHGVVWQANSGNGRIAKSDTPNSAHFFIYNTTSTGGSGGTGGTSASTTRNTFQNFIIQADYRTSNMGSAANGLGFWVKGNAANNAGYFVLFRLSSASGGGGSADMRIYGPGSGSGSLGTQLDSGNFALTTSVATSTDYTFRLQVEDVAGGVSFTGSMWNVLTGTQIGSNINYTHIDAGALTGAGQVGFRIGTGGSGNVSAFDNFSITPIPEPSAGVLALVAAAGAFFRRRRM